MRKILCLFIILIALSNIYAYAASDNELPVPGLDKKEKLNLSLSFRPEKILYYAFGFSDQDGKDLLFEDIPQAVPSEFKGTLNLSYDPLTSTANNVSNPVYIYYKSRTSDMYELSLSINSALESKTSILDYKIDIISVGLGDPEEIVFDTDCIDSGSNNVAVGRVLPAAESVLRYGSFQLLFNTDVIPALSEKITYSSSLSLQVTTI